MPRPLSDVRIIDFTHVVAGPVATSVLGTLGAEIIRIENTAQRGLTQQQPVDVRRRGMELNRNKKSITLNLLLPEAIEIAKKLVAIGDVVIDNFSPRIMKGFGLEYEDLVKVKPDIIVASMPAFGRSGPFRDRTSFGPGIDAISGLSHLTGYPDSTPLKPGNILGDYNAGCNAALAVISALIYRKRTGKGQHLEVAMRDGETQLVGEYILGYLLNNKLEERSANRHPTMAPHNVYPCQGEDKWVAITAQNDAEWAAICGVMGQPALANDPRFATVIARKKNEAELDTAISSWSRGQNHIEVMHSLQKVGVAAGAVMNAKEITEDAHFQSREAFPEVVLKDGSTIHLARPGWRAERVGIEIKRGPDYSEHMLEVLRDLLHYEADEIKHLHEIGAVVVPELIEELAPAKS